MPSTRPRRTLRRAIALLAVAAAAAAAWVLIPRLSGTGDAPQAGTGAAARPAEGAATRPATISSPPAPYTLKPEPTKVATDAPRSTSPDGQLTVVLTRADGSTGRVQASGFVDGVIEDDGTCTLTLTKGAQVVTVKSTGAADATTTSCGLMQTASPVTSGTWNAVLAYSSPRGTGSSRAMEVTVR